MAAHNFIDITGQKLGRWTVLRRDETKGKVVQWICECSCGNVKTVRGTHLKGGLSLSCGCLHKERAAEAATKHGEHGIPEYIAWKNMISRCYNPGNDRFHVYGGRGIHVCDDWRNDFSAFFRHIGKRPSPKHSVDRIDVNGNYEPGNIRWATPGEQANNKTNNRTITAFGETKTIKEWSDDNRCPVSHHVVKRRIYLGWDVEKAISSPKMKIKRKSAK